MLVSPMRTYTLNESTKSASLCLPKSIYPASVRPISGSSIFATPWTGRRLSSKNLKTPSRTTQSGALFLQVMQHSTISAASCRLIRDVGQCSQCQQGQVSTVDCCYHNNTKYTATSTQGHPHLPCAPSNFLVGGIVTRGFIWHHSFNAEVWVQLPGPTAGGLIYYPHRPRPAGNHGDSLGLDHTAFHRRKYMDSVRFSAQLQSYRYRST